MIGFPEKSASLSFNRVSIFAVVLIAASTMASAESTSQWSGLPRDYLLSINKNSVSELTCLTAVEDAHRSKELGVKSPENIKSNLNPNYYSICSNTLDPCRCYYDLILK